MCRISCGMRWEADDADESSYRNGLAGAGAAAGASHRTKRETVNEALREYIQRRKRLKALEAFGTVIFDPSYDYKKMRKAR